jgi:hypothetical protein
MGQHPPDFCLRTFNVPRSAIGSGSRRPEPAGPMSQLGRLPRFALRSLNGRFRRAPAATPVPSAVG